MKKPFRTFIIAICILLTSDCNNHAQNTKTINVIFRFDDVSAISNTDLELKIIDVFRKNEASITFGVIPFVIAGDWNDPSPQDVIPLTIEKGEILKNSMLEGILDIALHGYSHQTIDPEEHSEFADLDYASQVEKISKGKQLLENMIGAPVTIFVPPWNTYDLNTIKALEVLGFSTLSADRFGEAIKDSDLNFLSNISTIQNLKNSIYSARLSSIEQPIIVVMFHGYNFKEIDDKRGVITFQEFSHLISWLKNQEDVDVLSISQATVVIDDLSANRFLFTKESSPLYDFMESTLGEEVNNEDLYRETNITTIAFMNCIAFYLMIAIFGIALAFSIGYFGFRKSEIIIKIGTFASILLTTILLLYTFHDLQIYRTGMIINVSAVGISIGLIFCYLYIKEKQQG